MIFPPYYFLKRPEFVVWILSIKSCSFEHNNTLHKKPKNIIEETNNKDANKDAKVAKEHTPVLNLPSLKKPTSLLGKVVSLSLAIWDTFPD